MTALSMLYEVLDGAGAYNPVKALKRPTEPTPRPDGRSVQDVQGVLDALIGRAVANNRGWNTLARTRLIALTGMRHSQVMRLLREDFRLDDPVPFIIVGDPGKDGKPHIKPLNEEGVDAGTPISARRMLRAIFTVVGLQELEARVPGRERAIFQPLQAQTLIRKHAAGRGDGHRRCGNGTRPQECSHYRAIRRRRAREGRRRCDAAPTSMVPFAWAIRVGNR
jgi:hypothetical protein